MEYQKMVLIPIEQYNHWKNGVSINKVMNNDEGLEAKTELVEEKIKKSEKILPSEAPS